MTTLTYDLGVAGTHTVVLDGNRCTLNGKPHARGAILAFMRECNANDIQPVSVVQREECPGCHTLLEAHLVNGICDPCKAYETADLNMEARCYED